MYAPGAKVTAQWTDGGWYPAIITEVGNGQFFVTYDDGFTAWLGAHQIQPLGGPGAAPMAGGLAVGARVRSEYEGSWYSGTIQQMADGQYMVHYDDGDSAWKGAHELELEASMGGMKGGAAAGGLAVGMRVRSEYEGSWYSGTIQQMADGQYMVHYDDGDSAWKGGHELQPDTPMGGMKGAPSGPGMMAAGMAPGMKGGAMGPGMKGGPGGPGMAGGGMAPGMKGGPGGPGMAGGGMGPDMAGGGMGPGMQGGDAGSLVGQKMLAQGTDGGWHPATITELGDGKCLVTFDDGSTAWLFPDQLRPA